MKSTGRMGRSLTKKANGVWVYRICIPAKRRLKKMRLMVKPIDISAREASAIRRRPGLSAPFHFNPANRGKIVGHMKKRYASGVEETIRNADDICGHLFDLLGSGRTSLGQSIDWHRDFRSGYRWKPREYYLGGSGYVDCYVKKGVDADVKLPWELSRCQHFPTLGKAYWYTGDEKYAAEFVGEVLSWIHDNPIEIGVNWACTMDVAIRAVNWLWGYHFFAGSPTLDDRFRGDLDKSLFLHGRHIMNNLEYGEVRGNHYLSDLVGLVYLGIFFSGTADGKSWLDKGISGLVSEMGHQVYDDGTDFEGSTRYHGLATELFFAATVLAIRSGIAFPGWYMERLAKMIEFMAYCTQADGYIPQIGDNDSGRLFTLAGRRRLSDWRYLFSSGAALFGRCDFKAVSGGFREESFWLGGSDDEDRFDRLAGAGGDTGSRAFPAGGFYIMRKKDLCAIVDCVADDPRAPSGHKHNSRLSFELYAYGMPFIVDPGTYVYTRSPEERNRFRSTAYHNTVVVDGTEQNHMSRSSIFEIGQSPVKVNRFGSDDGCDFFDAEHYGYRRLDDPVTHRRQIFFDKKGKYWVVRDILACEGHHDYDLYFHFGRLQVTPEGQDTMGVSVQGPDGRGLFIRPLEMHGARQAIEDGYISPAYGVKEKAKVLKYSWQSTRTSTSTVLISTRPDLDDETVKRAFEEAAGLTG